MVGAVPAMKVVNLMRNANGPDLGPAEGGNVQNQNWCLDIDQNVPKSDPPVNTFSEDTLDAYLLGEADMGTSEQIETDSGYLNWVFAVGGTSKMTKEAEERAQRLMAKVKQSIFSKTIKL